MSYLAGNGVVQCTVQLLSLTVLITSYGFISTLTLRQTRYQQTLQANVGRNYYLSQLYFQTLQLALAA
jgi:hypothetical protein